MTVSAVLDAAGRRRSPATMPGYHAGGPPRNKGLRHRADPPTIEEIIRGDAPNPRRSPRRPAAGADRRALARRAARQEALALTERDLDPRRGSVLVANGKGGRPWSSAGVRVELRRLALPAGVRRRFAPHQLRHAHALELAREGVPLNIIQRQLGHVNLGNDVDLPAGDRHRRDHRHRARQRAPMLSATAGLRL